MTHKVTYRIQESHKEDGIDYPWQNFSHNDTLRVQKARILDYKEQETYKTWNFRIIKRTEYDSLIIDEVVE